MHTSQLKSHVHLYGLSEIVPTCRYFIDSACFPGSQWGQWYFYLLFTVNTQFQQLLLAAHTQSVRLSILWMEERRSGAAKRFCDTVRDQLIG